MKRDRHPPSNEVASKVIELLKEQPGITCKQAIGKIPNISPVLSSMFNTRQITRTGEYGSYRYWLHGTVPAGEKEAPVRELRRRNRGSRKEPTGTLSLPPTPTPTPVPVPTTEQPIIAVNLPGAKTLVLSVQEARKLYLQLKELFMQI